MSGGEQQMLAMGRALMARPRLLLLDEPSLGLAPVIVDKIYEIVREINAAGHHHPARRAERELRARRLHARLRARDRDGRAHRQLGEPAQRLARPGRVPRNMTLVLAAVGIKALWLLYIWLLSAIVCQWLSGQKGYTRRRVWARACCLSIVGRIRSGC